jgi:hypothetical protein
MRYAYIVIVGRHERKKPLGRPGRRWKHNINIDLKKFCVRMWAEQGSDSDQLRTLLNRRWQVSGM